MNTVTSLKTVTSNVQKLVEAQLGDTGGLLRLAPCWVPRSFLQPGKRLKLHPDDLYAYGLNRGGIDERWFASTTPAANDNRTPDEGLSYVVAGGERFTLQQAVSECGATLLGSAIWDKFGKWPVYSKFFDNMGPIPHHMHQNAAQAKLVGQEGKPESYYFPPQHNNVGNNFPYTFMGFEPGTTRAQVRKCLEDWNKGDNGILDLSRAYRLKIGTGWLIPPCVLHAPGSLCTYEPQWGSDVFGMYQSLVEGREVPWALLVKDMPKDKHQDLDFIVDQLDWEGNLDANFKDNHYLEPVPVADTRSEGYVDRWIVYGKVGGEQLFTAKELTVEPGVKATIKDNGAYGLICVQGTGKINGQLLTSPKLIRFHELTEDEYFATESGAKAGVTFENTSETEPLVCLRYFGPDANPDAPEMGAYRQNAFLIGRALSLGVTLLAGGALTALSAIDVPPLAFTQRTLTNGLAVYGVEDHATPNVAILVWYHVGSKDDPPKRSGFAHLFEHIMFKGTKNTAPETLDRLTEDVGGMNNAFTSDDVTVYHEVVPSHHLERLLWAEADRMTSLIVDDKNFRSEREVVKQEYLQSVDAQPYGRFGEEILKRSFAVHPYKRPTIGSIPDLNAATLSDVRDFFTSYYRPDNATLIVVGDFEPAQLNTWIDQHFGPIAKPLAPLLRVAVQEPPRKREQRSTMSDPAVPLPAFAATFLTPAARSEEALPLKLAVEMLAGGESSRLYRALVYEKGLAQSVEGTADLREDLGLLTFKVVLATGHTPRQVEDACFEEIDRLATAPPSAEELAKAKNRLLFTQLQERETNQGKGMALGEALVIRGDAQRVNTDLARLQAITADEIHRAVQKVLAKQNRLVLEVVPEAKAETGTSKRKRR